MTGTNDKVRSLILTALMVVSVFGGTVALSGSAVANHDSQGPAADDHVDSGSIHWQGQQLHVTGLTGEEEYQLRSYNGDLTEFEREFTTNSNGTAVLDTSDLEGQYVIQNPDSSDFVEFVDGVAQDPNGASDLETADWEVAVQDLDLSANQTEVGNGGTNTWSEVTVDSDRGGEFDAVVSSDTLSQDDLEDIFDAESPTASDDDAIVVSTGQGHTHDLDWSGQDAGNHTLEWQVTDSTASDELDFEVGEISGADANFVDSVVEEERGDVAAFTVDLVNRNSADIRVGGNDVGYDANLTVTDGDDDGEVTVFFNTYAPHLADSYTVSEDDDIDIENEDITESPSVPLDNADYDLISSIDDDEKDVATLVLNERGTESVTTYTAPEGVFGDAESAADVAALKEAGELTETSRIAAQDVAAVEISSTGIYGAYEAHLDSGETSEEAFIDLLGDDDDVDMDLTIVQTNPAPNREAIEILWPNTQSQGALNVVSDPANNTLYVAIDTQTARFYRGGDDGGNGNGAPDHQPEPGDEFNATFSIGENSNLVDDEEVESASSDWSLVERRANFNAQRETADNEPLVVVPAEENATVSGVTTVAPGTDLSVRARATGDSPFLKSNSTEVTADRTFTGTFDMENVSEGQNFTLSVPNAGFEDDVETAAVTGAAATATVSISDQSSDGSTVTVDSVNMSEGGFVTIHDATLLEGQALTSVRGSSGYLESGEQTSVEVSLDSPLEESQTVIAMPHMDTNDNQQYDFVSSEGASDGPYTEGGEPVTDDASVTLQTEEPGTPTPGTPTASPTDEPGTATPTPTDTDGQPGFGLVVSVLALLGAALLALRRD